MLDRLENILVFRASIPIHLIDMNDYPKMQDMYKLWKIFELFLFKGMDQNMQPGVKALKFDDGKFVASPFVDLKDMEERQAEKPKEIPPPLLPDRVEPPKPLMSERLRYLESIYKDT